MIVSPIMSRLIDINYFNNALTGGGGEPIVTRKKLITMRNFIRILLKLFKKDYDMKYNKRLGGSTESLGNYSPAVIFGDLNYSNQFQYPLFANNDRSFI